MKIKLLSISFLALAAVMVFKGTSAVSAEDLGVTRLIHDVNDMHNQATRSAEIQQKRLPEIIQHADTFINNRITSLNSLNTRIQNDARLTADEKSALTGQVQTAISGLTTLKGTIDADTSAQTALNDAKQIVTTYRVYEVLEPQTRLLITLHNIQTTVTNIQGLIPQLQNLINTLQTQGKDVTQLTPLLTDISSQLQTILNSISTDITTVQNVSPTTANPQTVFKQVQSDIQNVIKTDFAKVRQDIEQMRKIFRQLIVPNPHPTVIPTPTLTITPIP
jgi:hypothetical protein